MTISNSLVVSPIFPLLGVIMQVIILLEDDLLYFLMIFKTFGTLCEK